MAARCPICTQELEDVGAVRRHTEAVHGMAPSGDGWSSLPGPSGEPGWRPDPWNSNSLRYWDGQQWSGKTAAIGSVTDEAAPQQHKRWWGHHPKSPDAAAQPGPAGVGAPPAAAVPPGAPYQAGPPAAPYPAAPPAL
ncbi:MAG TPA: DUF2510 domain-containing protein, partial [Acidimicrobiales bacterium]|nr:DUF2510 domain-containing protein [Acidimicrobiales bacterium]